MKYWNHEGTHQAQYDALQEKLVPEEGNANTEAGEMMRCLSNVYYDVYNDGGGNLDHGRLSDLCGLIYYLDKTGFDFNGTLDLHKLLTELAEGGMGTLKEKRLGGLLDKAADHLVVIAGAAVS